MTFELNEYVAFDAWGNPVIGFINKLPDLSTSFYQVIYGNYNDGDFCYLLPEEMTRLSPVMKVLLELEDSLDLGVV